MPSPSSSPDSNRNRLRIEVSCKWPFSSATKWADTLPSAQKTRRAMVKEFERAGKGAWSDWQILDLKDLSVSAAGTNENYVKPAHLND